MKCNNKQAISDLIINVQIIKDEIERIADAKSKIKLQLFYDTENKDLINELENLKKRHIVLNERLISINEQLLKLINENSDK